MKYDAQCPNCGADKDYIFASGTVTAEATCGVLFDDAGNFEIDDSDFDYDTIYSEDYEHESLRCDSCSKSFSKPDLVPIDEEAKRLKEFKQLEEEGQRRLFK